MPQPDRATVGGAVAVDAAGPRRYAYGTMRRLRAGTVRPSTARARRFPAGGRVVKNAAGYNLCRLMTGSLGTLGVVTQVTLMVRPRARRRCFWFARCPTSTSRKNCWPIWSRSPARPVAIELVAGRQRESDLVLGPMLEGNVGRLYVGFEGAAAEVDWMVEQLRGRWAAAGATAPMLIPTGRAEPLWRWLTEFAADVQINVLPGAVIETIAKTLEIDPDCAIHAHAGDGVIRVKLGEGERTRERAGHFGAQ